MGKETAVTTRNLVSAIDLYGKIPPHATDFEEAVLGALLLEQKAFNDVDFMLTEDCFYKRANREIFVAVKELHDKSEAIDLLTVVRHLRAKSKLDSVGGSYYVATLTNKVVSTANIQYHAAVLRDKAIKRKLIEIGYSLTKEAYTEAEDADKIISKAEKDLLDLFVSNASSIIALKEGLIKVLRNVAENKADKKASSGMATGFQYFDNRSGGLQLSDLVVIAGETSQGKSSLALCIAKNVAQNGTPVAFYSLEMSAIQLCARITSIASSVPSSEILYSKVDDEKFDLINYGIGKVENLPIYIDDNGLTNIDSIISSIRFMVVRFGLKIAFIDYLQLANARGIGYNKEQEVSYMIQRLKNVAKELNICIVVLSQLSRDPNKNYEPKLSRLRDSGQIEQTADIVMFVYRPEHYDSKKKFPEPFQDKETKGYALIEVAKGRNIGIFKFLCAFDAKTTHFKNAWLNAIPNKSMDALNNENTPF